MGQDQQVNFNLGPAIGSLMNQGMDIRFSLKAIRIKTNSLNSAQKVWAELEILTLTFPLTTIIVTQ
jgi:hypothetical protein